MPARTRAGTRGLAEGTESEGYHTAPERVARTRSRGRSERRLPDQLEAPEAPPPHPHTQTLGATLRSRPSSAVARCSYGSMFVIARRFSDPRHHRGSNV